MDKIILKAQNEEELNSMIKRSLTLGEDETYKVKVLKYPKKILFVSIKGEYEVEIVKKSQVEDSKNEHLKKREGKNENVTLKPRVQTKNENKENDKKNSERRNSSSKDFQKNKIVKRKEENKETVSEKQIDANDANVSKIRSFIKEFLVNSKLEIVIVDIAKEGDKYIVNVDGKDMRYLIGEKGSSLNSIEYLLSSVKSLKHLKVVIDSNNYKQKREASLRELARKKGKKVLDSGKTVKLNPMSARERKIIHEEISFIKGLETESVGEDPKRYLVIKKTKNK